MPTTSMPSPVALERPPAVRARSAWLGFVAVCLAAVMDLLDSTIAQTAAPAIRAELGGSAADLQWTTAAYALALATGLLVGGRLGDAHGRRRMVLVGMGGFAVASTLCAVAQSPEQLIAARVVQGLVGALMLPQAFGLIRELFGDEGQRRAFGIFGPLMGLTAVVGPVLGGGLVDLDLAGAGWRAIFLVNVPVALVGIALGRRHLPATPPSAPGTRIDVPSAGLAAVGMTALVFPLVQGRELGWPWWSLALPVAGLAVLALFGRRQLACVRAGRAPLVEPSVLGRRAYVAGLGLVVAFIGAMGGMVLALNVLLQLGLGDSPLGAALGTLAVPLAAIVGSGLASALVGRLGRETIRIGTIVMALGLGGAVVVLHVRGGAVGALDLLAPLAVAGLGMGMVFVPMFDVILAGVEPHQLGTASGLLESTQQLGTSLGVAVVGTVLFGALAGTGAAAFADATATALLVAIGFLAVATLVVGLLPRGAREEA